MQFEYEEHDLRDRQVDCQSRKFDLRFVPAICARVEEALMSMLTATPFVSQTTVTGTSDTKITENDRST